MELIAIIILFSSFVGIGVIVFRKLPALVELPEMPSQFDFKKIPLKLKEKIVILNPFKNFSNEIFLQKVVSKTRILALRMESKMSHWLQKLREQAQRKKEKQNDNYWKDLKKPPEEK